MRDNLLGCWLSLSIENYAVIERLRVRLSPRAEPADGRDRQRQVDRGGRPGTAAGRPRVCRDGPHRRRAGAHLRPVRSSARPSRRARCWRPPGIETEDGELLIEREILAGGQVARLRRQPPGDGRAAARPGAAPGRHPRPARPAAAVRAGCATGDPRRLRRRRRPGRRGARILPAWRACRQELDDLERNEQEKLRLADLWSFQRREIEEASPKPGEDAELEAERRRLQNFARIEEAASGAYEALYDSPESALAAHPVGARGAWRNWLASIPRWPRSPRVSSPPSTPSRKLPTRCAITCRGSKPIPGGSRKSSRAWPCSTS